MRKQGKLLGGEGGVWRTGELPNLGDLVREKGHAEAFNLLKQKSENAQANRKRESEERVKNMVIPGGKKKRRKNPDPNPDPNPGQNPGQNPDLKREEQRKRNVNYPLFFDR